MSLLIPQNSEHGWVTLDNWLNLPNPRFLRVKWKSENQASALLFFLCISFSPPSDIDHGSFPLPFWRAHPPPPRARAPFTPPRICLASSLCFLLQEEILVLSAQEMGVVVRLCIITDLYCLYQHLERPSHCGKNGATAVVLSHDCSLHSSGEILKYWCTGSTTFLRF